MNIEVIRYRLPVYWACALINDDYTGLCKEECQEIKNFLNIADGYPVDVDWETEGFYQYNDAGTQEAGVVRTRSRYLVCCNEKALL